MQGWMSTGDHHGKKTTFVLFINGRPVDCGALRRALEATYATVLPKAQKPWIYLVRCTALQVYHSHVVHAQNLQLPPHHVDVNLHPTKSEVGFLHTDDIIAALQAHVQAQLSSADTQRTYTQTRLPGAPVQAAPSPTPGATSSQRALGIHDRKLVRTDPRTQTLHAFAVPMDSQPARGGTQDPALHEASPMHDVSSLHEASPVEDAPGVLATLTQSTARRRGASQGGAWMRYVDECPCVHQRLTLGGVFRWWCFSSCPRAS